MRRMTAVVVLVAALVGCGDDEDSTASTPTVTVSTTSTAASTVPPSVPPSTTAPMSVPTSTSTTATPPVTEPTTTTPTSGRVVAWPPPGTRFATPETVAADFVAHVFGTGAVLGAFLAGDARSGEMQVFASDETGRPIGTVRSTLLLRQVEGDSWSVLAAVSDGASISTPSSGDIVDRVITVAGRARGFEANVNVRAIPVDDPGRVLDETITMGGGLARPRPYSVELDLSGAVSGSVVLVVVHGGVGLETDPGDTAVIPIVIA